MKQLLSIINNQPHRKLVVHVVLDDKFIDAAYREFELVAPGVGIYVIPGRQRQLSYIHEAKVFFATDKEMKQLFASKCCKAVVFHTLNDWALKYLEWIPQSKKVIWLGWGYDYYDRLLSEGFPGGLFQKQTTRLLQSTSLIRVVLDHLRKKLRYLFGRDKGYRPELLARVDCFSPVLDIEYDMAIKFNPSFCPEYLAWNYGTAEDDYWVGSKETKHLGNDILVGNSATPANNHIEVFSYLHRHVDWHGRKIIVPLSYGDDWYKRKIVDIGRNMFGDAFFPLLNYLDKQSYVSLLDTCGYVFMNHIRQQAMGNIIVMLQKGAKIFLNENGLMWRWFLDKGAAVQHFTCSDEEFSGVLIQLEPLEKGDVYRNIEFVKRLWGRDAQRAKTRQFMKYALTDVRRTNKLTLKYRHLVGL